MISLSEYGYSKYYVDDNLELYRKKKNNNLAKVKYNKTKKDINVIPIT
ncbi:hypothetical protein METROID_223 [Staphylococcus phage Metroid]|nr:hypothetical protein METROID_223 [Staphylococcus phage Metroid]